MAVEAEAYVVENVVDSTGRLRNARPNTKEEAFRRRNDRHQKVLSVVEIGPGAGGEVLGSKPAKVPVPGYREGAVAYYLEVTCKSI
jgi:hypothetical protein